MIKTILDELAVEIEAKLENWDIKGFVDTEKNVYVVSQDTKLLSKIFELYLTPLVREFAAKHDLQLAMPRQQNQYPDYSLRGEKLGIGDKWLALDLKSTYRNRGAKGNILKSISGFTLGTARGALRNQTSTTYSTFPYVDYGAHWCLCFVYTRSLLVDEEHEVYKFTLEQLNDIPPVIEDIEVVAQEKHKISWYTLGSGNTYNIGSVKNITDLRNGTGPFAERGKEQFEHYWINFMRLEDAKQQGLVKQPYKDLKEFDEWMTINPIPEK